MICKRCGIHFSTDEQFCPSCGYPTNTNIDQQPMQNADTPYVQQPMQNAGAPYAQQPAQYPGSPYQNQNMNNYSGQQYGQQPSPQYYPQMGLKKERVYKIACHE